MFTSGLEKKLKKRHPSLECEKVFPLRSWKKEKKTSGRIIVNGLNPGVSVVRIV